MRAFDHAPKRATNLSLNLQCPGPGTRARHEPVADRGRPVGGGSSQRYWERWNEQNREAVQAYNERIEREGLPLAGHRTFMKRR